MSQGGAKATDKFEFEEVQQNDETPRSVPKRTNKHLKIVIYMLLVIIVLLTVVSCVLIAYVVKSYNNNNDNNKSDITTDSIEGLDNYLREHCVLHQDIIEGECMDLNGAGVSVIRDPTDIPSPINIAYSPLLNNVTGEIEYFTNKDSNGNLVAKPLCQTDFDTSTYTMKGNSYVFDEEKCEYPLPLWMNETDILNLPRRYQPIIHRITLTTVEVVAELESGHTFEFQTYNATVPGPPLRVRVGDWVDLTFINPESSLHEHSIDFHAMCGPGGGATSLRANPGEKARTIWQAIIPGMFIYHCASGWVSEHISKGMYGAIIVEPEFGFPYSDLDIYLGQSELYLHYPLVNNWGTQFKIPKPNLHNTFDPIKERYEMSDVVMLNGAPFSLVHNPIITTVGSVVRCFVVAGGPNHISSFHIIGDSFDRVWLHADFNAAPQQNIQTTTIPPGGCAVADWRHDTPGAFIFVDHALTRAFVRGNLGIIKACDRNDLGCISGSSLGSYGAKYTCNPNRYAPSDDDYLIGNDDCLFCPWSRNAFDSETVDNETSDIYSYLDQQCSNGFDSNGIIWQGDESRHNDTVSNISNHWRKNRYPGTWSLSQDLRIVDAIIGNPRNGSCQSDFDEQFDYSTCIVTAGEQSSMSIEYSIHRNGHGQITISTPIDGFINGGWIGFGRGGNGISAMKDAHIYTALFNHDATDIKFEHGFIRDYGTPIVDDSTFKFPISNPSLIISTGKVSFTFDILTGDWILPTSGLATVPMIIGIGEMGDGLQIALMNKHFDKDILHFDIVGKQCLFGGTKLV